MKYLATIYQTVELKIEVYASSEQGALNMVVDLDEADFSHRDVIDYRISVEPAEECYETA